MGGNRWRSLHAEGGLLDRGKFADVAVLEKDPYEGPAETTGDIRVLGTLVGGRFHRTARVASNSHMSGSAR